jgi:hypothetical protein
LTSNRHITCLLLSHATERGRRKREKAKEGGGRKRGKETKRDLLLEP